MNIGNSISFLQNFSTLFWYAWGMGEKEKRPYLNSRQIHKQNDRKYLLMVVFTLVVLGGGLIGLIYGWMALLTALPFLLLGAGLILLPWLVLVGLEKLVERRERK